MQRIEKAILAFLLIGLTFTINPIHTEEVSIPKVRVIEVSEPEMAVEEAEVVSKPVEMVSATIVTDEVDPVKEEILSQEEIELIALVTMAEAEGESEYGKRLVIDTILNRVDHDRFPDTVTEVIYQPSQFTSMWNGRVDRCYVREDICELVREELQSRTNSEVTFFTAGNYGKYGVSMFHEGNHYFSSYE